MPKRKGYINWDEYFMGIALLSGERSKDPNSQVGACIVSKDNKILSMGYNGFPIGCSDEKISWEREGNTLDTKYPYVCHAELNAILNYRGSLTDFDKAIIYCTLFPCNECAKALSQVGIKKIYYLEDKHHDDDIYCVSRFILDECGVEYEKGVY